MGSSKTATIPIKKPKVVNSFECAESAFKK